MTGVLLRIGEFARLVQLPVRTVRYYSDLGLLPPSRTEASGYRLYSLGSIERARRLLALRDMGLSLDDIGRVLDDELSPDQFRSLLAAQVERLESELSDVADTLERARRQLAELERRLETPMADVTVKTTDPISIASLRDRIGGVGEIGQLYPRLFAGADPAHGVGPAGAIYHHFADDGRDIDIEVVIPVPGGYEASGEVEVRDLEPVLVASLIHRGAFNRLHEAHGQLLEWVAANDYEVAGPAYEWNLVCTEPVTQDNESYVTEVQVEVRATGS